MQRRGARAPLGFFRAVAFAQFARRGGQAESVGDFFARADRDGGVFAERKAHRIASPRRSWAVRYFRHARRRYESAELFVAPFRRQNRGRGSRRGGRKSGARGERQRIHAPAVAATAASRRALNGAARARAAPRRGIVAGIDTGSVAVAVVRQSVVAVARHRQVFQRRGDDR